ncbi:recombinase family protein [Paenibacillus sp. VTT E-133280]|uniref:recombinase family protein n=1 Tax=Paenibacillus sp. VTT E-133280 TaxID=1986222 RepID=UPI000BA0213D|nr:recombinase family protein [Paenibacillus sp. VTT E-133280]
MLMTSDKVRRVAIYVRVSTEEQAEHGYSIDAQLKTLTDYSKLYNYEIYREYVDRGISGKSMDNRFELQQMLQDAKNNLFDTVLVWKFNRLARNAEHLSQIVNILNKNNVAFMSMTEQFDTSTSHGKFMLHIMGAVGQLERDTIVDNVKMGHKQRARTGKHNGKLPLGYRSVEDIVNGVRSRESKVEIVPEEEVIILKIFERFATGRGFKSIANELNHEGYVTRSGGAFSISGVKEILDNPFFVGRIRYGRYENWSEKRRKGLNTILETFDGIHPAIVSEELWSKVQYLRKKKSVVSLKRFDGEFLLTWLIRCPKCGAPMVANRTQNRKKDGSKVTRLYYSCSNFRNKGSKVCSANSIRKLEAENYVIERLKEVLAKPQILKAIVKNINERKTKRVKPLEQELEHILVKITELEGKRRKYFDMYEMNGLDKTMFSKRLDDIGEELERLHVKKTELAMEMKEDHAEPVSYEVVRALLNKFDKLLDSSSFDQRKTLMHLVIKQITIKDSKTIDQIDMNFDENTVHHFLTADPSATHAEGSFAVQMKREIQGQSISIAI